MQGLQKFHIFAHDKFSKKENMKRIITLALFLISLLAVGQNTNLTAQQSAKRIAQLKKITQQYDTR